MTTLLLPDAAGGTLEKALYDRFASSLEAQGWEIVGGLELLPGASGRFVERVYKFKIRKGSSDEEMDVVYKVFRDKPSVGDQSRMLLRQENSLKLPQRKVL